MSIDYLLGHDTREWSRLAEQHALWGPAFIAELQRLGLGSGSSILEMGCGAGDLLLDIANLVGPAGRAIGLERDPRAAARTRARLSHHGDVETGDLFALDPQRLGGPFDAVIARWVLSFVPRVDLALERMLAAVRPGGLIIVQDYNHDGIGIWPRVPAIDRCIEAFRAAYAARGGDLWVATRLPGLLRALELEAIELAPRVLAGLPDSAVWRWVERFLMEHLETVVAAGHLDRASANAFQLAWNDSRQRSDTVLFSPQVVTVTARRPAR
jgi:SAM-dependent methyltransferase